MLTASHLDSAEHRADLASHIGDREVEQESVMGLIRDLTVRLTAVATEFGERAERAVAETTASVPANVPAGPAGTSRRVYAERLMAERRERLTYFAPNLFHEPAWDMLLALYVAYEEGRVLNVKALVGSSDAPVTTSQRWIDHLHKLGLVNRVGDQEDRRRIEVSLSDAGRIAIERYLDAIGSA